MKIEKMTPEQEARLPEFRDKWLQIGLSTEPLDLERAKDAVGEVYRAAKMEPPSQLYVFDSPFSAALGAVVIESVSDQVSAQVRSQVRGQVSDQVSAQVSAQVSDQVWGQVSAQVSDQVSDQVWGQVRGQVSDQVSAQVRSQVSDQVWDQVWAQVYGAHDAPWLSFYDFMHEVMGVDCAPLNGLTNLAKYCGWWAPYKSVAILQHRPASIKFDDRDRLHCEDGPAIEYRDGFSVHSWHGTRVPAEWLGGELTPEVALTHENVEQRRAACEILGWETVLTKLNATSIHKHDNAEIGELVEVDIPDIGREKFLRVTCGTGRRFALPVPPEMETADQANAWTYGFDNAEDYELEIRT